MHPPARILCTLLRSPRTADDLTEALNTLFGQRRRWFAPFTRRFLRFCATHPKPSLAQLRHFLSADRSAHRFILLPTPPAAPASWPIPQLPTLAALAAWLNLDLPHLYWLADLRNLTPPHAPSPLGHYHHRLIAKPYGTPRLIESPKPTLKRIQQQILAELLNHIPPHSAAHGFRRQHSILTFAAPHVARAAILRLDLQDFFPTLSGPRIQALFASLGYPRPVANLLGGLCTTAAPPYLWRDTGLDLTPEALHRARQLYTRPHLPQGAPTSPALANLAAWRADTRLLALANASGATYTRYADDLAFSGGPSFARSANRFAAHATAILADEGFRLHPRKTRLMRPAIRQHLTGITLNQHPNLSRPDYDRLKATLTNCIRHGPATQNLQAHPHFRQHLEGRVAHATRLNPARALRLQLLLNQIAWPETKRAPKPGTPS